MLNCHYGIPDHPCANVEVVPVFQDPTVAAGQNVRTPRGSGSRNKPSLLDELSSIFKALKPFRSKKGKNEIYLIRKKPRKPVESPAAVHHIPRAPTPPPPNMPRRCRSPIIVPIAPQRRHRSPSPRVHWHVPRERRRQDQRPVVTHQSSSGSSSTSSSEEETPSPPIAARTHKRRSGSLSPRSKHEAEEKILGERERRIYAGVAKEEERARKRAERVAEFERLERKRALQERIGYEEKSKIESTERARIQAQRRQQQEDLAACEAQQRREERDRRRRQRDRWEEEDRLGRARRAHIPRQPRHQPELHYGGMYDIGARFIQEAIRRENLRRCEELQANRDAGRLHRRYGGGGMRRRRTIGDGGGARYWREV